MDDIEPAIKPQQQVVGITTEMGQPFVVYYNAVEFITVEDQKSPFVLGGVDQLFWIAIPETWQFRQSCNSSSWFPRM